MKIMEFGAALTFMLAVTVGCGQGDSTQPAKQITPETTSAEPAAKPEANSERPAPLAKMLIAKVPVDANGNELNDQAEIREVFQDASITDELTAQQVFGTATNSVTIADELDQDSSSEQCYGFGCGARRFYYWNTPWYPGKLLGRGLWWGRNPWVSYRGYAYGYRNIGCYSGAGFNYYPYTYVNPVGPVGGPGAGVGFVNPVGPAGGPGAGAGYVGVY